MKSRLFAGTFASRLVMAGISPNAVRELLGHAALTPALRYVHLAPERKAAAVAALEFKEPAEIVPLRGGQ